MKRTGLQNHGVHFKLCHDDVIFMLFLLLAKGKGSYPIMPHNNEMIIHQTSLNKQIDSIILWQ